MVGWWGSVYVVDGRKGTYFWLNVLLWLNQLWDYVCLQMYHSFAVSVCWGYISETFLLCLVVANLCSLCEILQMYCLLFCVHILMIVIIDPNTQWDENKITWVINSLMLVPKTEWTILCNKTIRWRTDVLSSIDLLQVMWKNRFP